MDKNPDQWPNILEGVLLAHRVSSHLSTKYSSFYLIYNREPLLPVDLIYGLNPEFVDLSKPFDQDMFRAVLSIANAIRDKMHEGAGRNKKKAQAMQKSDFDCQH